MSNRIKSFQRELAEANRKVSNTLFVPAEQLSRQQRRCRMKRRFQGLEETTQLAGNQVPDGLFLVRVEGTQYRRHAQKPFYWLRLAVLEPREFVGRTISGRLYCTPKALWKLGWFLRDFLYDVELLGRAKVDEKALFGLRGIVKISRSTVRGRSLLNLEGFAPASRWEEFSTPPLPPVQGSGLAK